MHVLPSGHVLLAASSIDDDDRSLGRVAQEEGQIAISRNREVAASEGSGKHSRGHQSRLTANAACGRVEPGYQEVTPSCEH